MWTVLLGLNSAVWRKQFNRAINSPMMWKCNCCCRCFWRSSCICNTTEGRHQSPWNYIHHAPSILCSHICNTSTAHALHSTADASVTSGLHSLCSLSCLQLSGVESPSHFAAVQQKWNVVFVAFFFFFNCFWGVGEGWGGEEGGGWCTILKRQIVKLIKLKEVTAASPCLNFESAFQV